MAARQPKLSAGIALIRGQAGEPEVLLVHPGGPYWAGKDEHGWSIPKGELTGDDRSHEAVEATARREFEEETGHPVPAGELRRLAELRIASGKVLCAFAAWGDLDPAEISSNTFEMEWPPRSGRTRSFPEVDRGAWFGFAEARRKLHKGQVGLVDRLEAELANYLRPGGRW
jgi:predicted NUDIX family NTP pyrophosphohydrolase